MAIDKPGSELEAVRAAAHAKPMTREDAERAREAQQRERGDTAKRLERNLGDEGKD